MTSKKLVATRGLLDASTFDPEEWRGKAFPGVHGFKPQNPVLFIITAVRSWMISDLDKIEALVSDQLRCDWKLSALSYQ
jgi:hypothetical protein